jgi:hypothetical protein
MKSLVDGGYHIFFRISGAVTEFGVGMKVK